MSLIKELENKSTIRNTKGGLYYETAYDSNLDLYAGVSRFNNDNDILLKFHNAYKENRVLALANLLYFLDIRDGKGERRIFKIIFKDLCNFASDDARIILKYISKLGRYDYILEGLFTDIEADVIKLIKFTLNEDIDLEHPSLLAKWLPSHSTHSKSNKYAKRIVKLLGITEKEYRIMLSSIRTKINIVEKNLTNKEYDSIIFDEVPSKAMLKYNNVFNNKIKSRFNEYKKSLKKGESKINTGGLFCYEIIKKIMDKSCQREVLNAMWENQKCISIGDKNVLVVADTSGSMWCNGGIPYASSIGLAIYTAQRNKGVFKDTFITFSKKPKLHKVKGNDIIDKYKNIKTIVANTDIDKVFELILNTMISSNSSKEDIPSHIIIISDMEFDAGVYSSDGTNFDGWKKSFNVHGYELPKIIFWNVAGHTRGFPVTKNDNDVIMISGFSTNLLEGIFDVENFNPSNQMLNALGRYIEMIEA